MKENMKENVSGCFFLNTVYKVHFKDIFVWIVGPRNRVHYFNCAV